MVALSNSQTKHGRNVLSSSSCYFLSLSLFNFLFVLLCLPPLINSPLSPGEFFHQSRHGLWSWFCFWFYQRRSVSPASGRPLPHHPPPHQGVQIRRGQRTQRWVCLGLWFVCAGYMWAMIDFVICSSSSLFQMCLPPRSPSMTGTAPQLPAALNDVSSATTLRPRHQERPLAWARCPRRPKGWRSARAAPWGSGLRAPRPPSWVSHCKVDDKHIYITENSNEMLHKSQSAPSLCHLAHGCLPLTQISWNKTDLKVFLFQAQVIYRFLPQIV